MLVVNLRTPFPGGDGQGEGMLLPALTLIISMT